MIYLVKMTEVVKELRRMGFTVAYDEETTIHFSLASRTLSVIQIDAVMFPFKVETTTNNRRYLRLFYGPRGESNFPSHRRDILVRRDGTFPDLEETKAILRSVLHEHISLTHEADEMAAFEKEMSRILGNYLLPKSIVVGRSSYFPIGKKTPVRDITMDFTADHRLAHTLLEALVAAGHIHRSPSATYTPLEVLHGMLATYQRAALDQEIRRSQSEPLVYGPLEREIEALRTWIGDCVKEPTTVPFWSAQDDCLLVNDYDSRMCGLRPVDAPPALVRIKIPNPPKRERPSRPSAPQE